MRCKRDSVKCSENLFLLSLAGLLIVERTSGISRTLFSYSFCHLVLLFYLKYETNEPGGELSSHELNRGRGGVLLVVEELRLQVAVALGDDARVDLRAALRRQTPPRRPPRPPEPTQRVHVEGGGFGQTTCKI